MVMYAVITLGAPTSGQLSSIRFKSSSVQSLSKTIFCPPSVIVLFLSSSSSSSSSSLSLSGPMLARPRNSAGEKAECWSAWEDTGTMQPSVPHTRFSQLPIYTGERRAMGIMRQFYNFKHVASINGPQSHSQCSLIQMNHQLLYRSWSMQKSGLIMTLMAIPGLHGCQCLVLMVKYWPSDKVLMGLTDIWPGTQKISVLLPNFECVLVCLSYWHVGAN